VDVSSSVARVATRRARYQVSWILALPYPLRNMLRRWRGMLGMILGVGIALGIGMTMLAVSNAIVAIFSADYRRSGADLYVVTEGGTLIAILPGDSPGTIDRGRHTLARIRALPGVTAAIGAMNWTMERDREGPRRRNVTAELIAVMGIDGDPALIPNALDLQAGRWLRRSHEVVVGSKLGREKQLGVGDTLRLNGRDFTIVGIGKLRGFGFSTDAVAYMDAQAFRLRADVGDMFNVIAVDSARPAEARQRILDLESLSVFEPQELVRLAEEADATSAMVRMILSMLTLSIAALFVSNMLSRSVAERRLEFATLRAIGIPTRTILLTVAGEALLVSVVAGVVGIGISQLLGALLNGFLAPSYGFEALYVADLHLFGLIFALALGLGLLAGLFPARSATRVDPVDVLREA
jgi:putative ABC transport system permease protein